MKKVLGLVLGLVLLTSFVFAQTSQKTVLVNEPVQIQSGYKIDFSNLQEEYSIPQYGSLELSFDIEFLGNSAELKKCEMFVSFDGDIATSFDSKISLTQGKAIITPLEGKNGVQIVCTDLNGGEWKSSLKSFLVTYEYPDVKEPVYNFIINFVDESILSPQREGESFEIPFEISFEGSEPVAIKSCQIFANETSFDSKLVGDLGLSGFGKLNLGHGTYSIVISCIDEFGKGWERTNLDIIVEEVIVPTTPVTPANPPANNPGTGGGGGSSRSNPDDDDGNNLDLLANNNPDLNIQNLANEVSPIEDSQISYSKITGAVVGAIGERGTIGIGIFFLVLAAAGFFLYNKTETVEVANKK